MKVSDDKLVKLKLYGDILSDQDMDGIKWLAANSGDKHIYTGSWYEYPFGGYGSTSWLGTGSGKKRSLVLGKGIKAIENAYFYLGSLNVKGNLWVPGRGTTRGHEVEDLGEISTLIEEGNRIYCNGGSEVYAY